MTWVGIFKHIAGRVVAWFFYFFGASLFRTTNGGRDRELGTFTRHTTQHSVRLIRPFGQADHKNPEGYTCRYNLSIKECLGET